MLKSQKPSCTGCVALKSGSGFYECKLKHLIDFKIIDGNATAPKPMQKCYKPKTEQQFKEALNK